MGVYLLHHDRKTLIIINRSSLYKATNGNNNSSSGGLNLPKPVRQDIKILNYQPPLCYASLQIDDPDQSLKKKPDIELTVDI